MAIHPTAIIGKKAHLNKDVEIGPYTIVEDEVKIGQKVKILSHAQILNHTIIGDDCRIHMGAVLGHAPQIRRDKTQEGRLVIGQRNIFREYATVHRSSTGEGSTVIGNDNYFMAFSHIAHDCHIANYVTICNGVLIAGHALIEEHAFISGNVTVHQFCRIGRFSMVGGLARVAKDVPPYMLVKGDSIVWALNSVGLRRANFSHQARVEIKKAFKLLYKSGLNTKQAIMRLKDENASCDIEYLINFIQNSRRGICDHKNPGLWERIRSSVPTLKHRQIPAYRLFQRQCKQQEGKG